MPGHFASFIHVSQVSWLDVVDILIVAFIVVGHLAVVVFSPLVSASVSALCSAVSPLAPLNVWFARTVTVCVTATVVVAIGSGEGDPGATTSGNV